MKRLKMMVLAVGVASAMVAGILPGCVEQSILRAVTPFLLS